MGSGSSPSSEPRGKYEDSLRALGRFIEPFSPSELELLECGEQFEVSWRIGAEQRTQSQTFNIQALREFSRSFRMRVGRAPGISNAELLRAIGRSLDRLKAERLFLQQTTTGYSAVFPRAGQSVTRLNWSRRDLAALVATLQREHYPPERAQTA